MCTCYRYIKEEKSKECHVALKFLVEEYCKVETDNIKKYIDGILHSSTTERGTVSDTLDYVYTGTIKLLDSTFPPSISPTPGLTLLQATRPPLTSPSPGMANL